jgi:hypothetical protein
MAHQLCFGLGLCCRIKSGGEVKRGMNASPIPRMNHLQLAATWFDLAPSCKRYFSFSVEVADFKEPSKIQDPF